ncbi:MAG: phosphoribosylformylglycinamidine synthase subunit PurS [Thermoanaerobaculia bacterium]|nr:phosphoribosylformylglycinamidine synthase subunit PurS [Thermoanaerobaculia bacterium]
MSPSPETLPTHRIEIEVRPEHRDPRGAHVAAQVSDFLDIPIDSVRTRDVYHLVGRLSSAELERVVQELADPVLQRAAIGRLEAPPFDEAVTVAYKPGVTDPVGKSALVAIEDTLGRSIEGAAVFTSVLYLLEGVDHAEAERIAHELLANPVIETIRVEREAEWRASEPDLSVPRIAGGDTPAVGTVDLSGSADDLERLSREGLLALSVAELEAIRDHFRAAGATERRRAVGLGGAPTDVELECLAQTWSEHCKHKIFNAVIDYREGDGEAETIDSLFSTYIRGVTEAVDRRLREASGGSWLKSVFHDNAGVVAFDEDIHLVYKVETHNSPSALDPYGGAITGIVGVNRDPFGTGRGADLLLNVWGYCFASPFFDGELPKGLLHPRRVRDGVHRGVIDGGNQSGIPYARGWELFDHRYLGKPLVFCGTVGALPVEIAGTPGEEKAARPGDVVVMVGGRIGADGIHGATFSSAALDEASPAQAVQIGDPITQKMMFDFLLEARNRGLYTAITDNGAGGLSSSVGEMAETPGGARLDLARAPLKYAGLAPWEIFLSEAQERMTVAVPPESLDEFLELAARRQVEATALGEFTAEPELHVTYDGETVALLDMEFLHDGLPEMRLEARWAPPVFEEPPERPEDCSRTLVDLVGRLNLASSERVARHYDHEVKGLAVVKPWIGVANDVPAEATVSLAHHGSRRGIVLSEGVNPFLSDLDTYAMAQSVVDEAVRRQLCAGARLDRIAALDNFCWPDPVLSARTPDGDYKLAQLVRACRGLYDTCLAYGVPLVSGKDSMKNESTVGGVKICVPPTLLVSAIGQIDDVESAVTLDFKAEGDAVYLLGRTGHAAGGSEYYRWLGERDGRVPIDGGPAPYVGSEPPRLDPGETLPLYRALASATSAGLVRSAATPTKGGLGVALARSALAGRLGAELALDEAALEPGLDSLDDDLLLFAESNGRFVVTVEPERTEAFESLFENLPCRRIGTVTKGRRLTARHGGRLILDVALEEAWESFAEGLRYA